jgi:hypothetical protein
MSPARLTRATPSYPIAEIKKDPASENRKGRLWQALLDSIGFTTHCKSFVVQIFFTSRAVKNTQVTTP